jgi:hypothetical protein
MVSQRKTANKGLVPVMSSIKTCRATTRILAAASLAVLVLSLSVFAGEPDSTQSPEYRPAPGAPAASGQASGTKPTERLREGTRLIDVPGSFVSLGPDSVTFAPTGGKDAYRVLENLALQRVCLQLDDNRGPRQWVVSGLITEFRGSNYLLVTKAVVQLQDGDSPTNR